MNDKNEFHHDTNRPQPKLEKGAHDQLFKVLLEVQSASMNIQRQSKKIFQCYIMFWLKKSSKIACLTCTSILHVHPTVWHNRIRRWSTDEYSMTCKCLVLVCAKCMTDKFLFAFF